MNVQVHYGLHVKLPLNCISEAWTHFSQSTTLHMKLNRVHYKNETKQWIKGISFNWKGGWGEQECQSKNDKTAWKLVAHLSTCQPHQCIIISFLPRQNVPRPDGLYCPIKHEIAPLVLYMLTVPYIFYHLLTSSTPCLFCFWKLVSKSILLLQITSWLNSVWAVRRYLRCLCFLQATMKSVIFSFFMSIRLIRPESYCMNIPTTTYIRVNFPLKTPLALSKLSNRRMWELFSWSSWALCTFHLLRISVMVWCHHPFTPKIFKVRLLIQIVKIDALSFTLQQQQLTQCNPTSVH